MRHKAPDVERPYRTWGYPVVPGIYMTLATVLIVDLAYLAPSTSGVGYLLVLTGVPFYFAWRRAVVVSSASLAAEGADTHPELRS
jgi:APA family basic amino acid/polyamine antiporter